MNVSPGTRFGPYEILSPLGAGGMGEVYLARDTRLGRDVAIKVLPPHLADDPQSRQRFEREARAVSGLNHPHICTLHDVGEQDGVHFLVMEHLEGETLARRLEKGALPVEEALGYAIEIADALDVAHRQGVVHRDLKPGNVMLTGGGAKLLDFGLAKSAGAAPAGSSLTAAPTGTSPLTAEGTIVGTFQYMAPEQLEGKEADARSDIFAFGAVVYEMITGRKAFEGKTQASVIGAIMRGEPRPPSSVIPMTPPALERLVLTCLAKDPDDRRQSVRDVLLDLRWIAGGGSEEPAVTAAGRGRAGLWMAGTVVLALAAAVLGWIALAPRAPLRRPVTLSLTMPVGAEDALFLDQVVVSPDGNTAAFVMHDTGGEDSLWIRDLGSAQAHVLPGTEGASSPFWSPDSRFLGFFADDKLKKIDTEGGPPQVLCPVVESDGGTWSRDGIILFGHGETGGIYRISASGGNAEPATRMGSKDEAHRWPAFLPDGRHFVFLIDAENTEDHHLGIGSLDSQDVTPLFNMISNVAFAPPGYLLFGRSGSLIAQPFDAKTLGPSGDPIALASNLVTNGRSHRREFSASGAGILTYRSANLDSRLTWVDASGNPLEAVGDPGRYNLLALSPDKSEVVLGKLDADGRTGDLWVLDLARNVTSRLTFHPGAVHAPQWSPDGVAIVYSSAHDGPRSKVYRKPVDGSGQEQLLFDNDKDNTPECVSPDGRNLLVSIWDLGNQDLWTVPLEDPGKARQLTRTPFSEAWARFSPDGRWISYVSDESGRDEVYVQDFPAMTSRVLVSTDGGNRAEWRADGKEIYYVDSRDRLAAVAVTYGPSGGLQVSQPRELFRLRGNSYAPGRDGKRFLVDLPAEDPLAAPVTVVLDWTSSLSNP